MRAQPIAFGTTGLITGVVLTVLAAFALGVLPTGSNGSIVRVVDTSPPIEVHGDWTLTLLDLDGSVVRTVAFENALTGFGAGKLAEFLAGEQTVGTWKVNLSGDNGPCDDGGNAIACVASEECVSSAHLGQLMGN